jgi:hypothetical protein
MTESNQLADDLHFVRQAVEKRDRPGRPLAAGLLIWAAYSIICIPSYDLVPQYSGRINLVGWLAAAVLTGVFRKRATIKSGQFDREMIARSMLHWFGGVALLLVAVFGLVLSNSGINELVASQVSIILVGFLYFTAGVHMPEVRFMRWAGPIIVLAGVASAWVTHFRWTAVGAIFAACLLFPLFIQQRPAAETKS